MQKSHLANKHREPGTHHLRRQRARPPVHHHHRVRAPVFSLCLPRTPPVAYHLCQTPRSSRAAAESGGKAGAQTWGRGARRRRRWCSPPCSSPAPTWPSSRLRRLSGSKVRGLALAYFVVLCFSLIRSVKLCVACAVGC